MPVATSPLAATPGAAVPGARPGGTSSAATMPFGPCRPWGCPSGPSAGASGGSSRSRPGRPQLGSTDMVWITPAVGSLVPSPSRTTGSRHDAHREHPRQDHEEPGRHGARENPGRQRQPVVAQPAHDCGRLPGGLVASPLACCAIAGGFSHPSPVLPTAVRPPAGQTARAAFVGGEETATGGRGDSRGRGMTGRSAHDSDAELLGAAGHADASSGPAAVLHGHDLNIPGLGAGPALHAVHLGG